MIHFIHNVPEEVIAISVDGQLTEEDYDKYNRMVRLKEPAENLKLYLEIEEWKGMTFAALVEDIKTGFKHYEKISKIALAASEDWIKKWTKVSDVITPGIDVRFFEISDRARAMDWLNKNSPGV